MKGFCIKLFGKVSERICHAVDLYKMQKINKLLGGGERVVQYPFQISGAENICAGEHLNIGKNAVIMTKRAQLIIKEHFVSGPGLTIITGDHMPVIGKYLDEVSDNDKDEIDTVHKYDKDVIIEEDVWCGANVTILKGVTIGRGCIIASGAVVTKTIPPYTIAGGIPAVVIKNKWTFQDVIQHEKLLYSETDRLPLEVLSHLQ